MKITLPLPPNMANKSWGHWTKKHKAQKAYMVLCMLKHKCHGGTLPAGIRKEITATIYNTRLMDQDNAMARLKWPVDWINRTGFIVDDDPDHLVWTGLPTQVKCKKDERRVEFVLEAA